MAELTFPRFPELPKELQMQIWKDAAEGTLKPDHPNHDIIHFAQEANNLSRRGRQFTDPRSRQVKVYILSGFQGSDVMDSCLLARQVTLEWLLGALETRGLFWGVYSMKGRMIHVFENLIEDIKRRLRSG